MRRTGCDAAAQVVPLDAAAHRVAQELLPWYAACSLGHEDVLRVEAHLAGCAHCQASLRWEQGLLAQYRALEVAGDAQRAFGALRLQLELRRARGRVLPSFWQRMLRAWQDAAPWLRRTLVVQFVVVLGLRRIVRADDTRRLSRARQRRHCQCQPGGEVSVRIRRRKRFASPCSRSARNLPVGPPPATPICFQCQQGQARAALARLRERPTVILAESLDAAGVAP